MLYSLQNNSYYYQSPGDASSAYIGEEVAVVFSTKTWEVLTHGHPLPIITWAGMEAAKSKELGKYITVISGKIPVDDLNKIITVSGAIKHFVGQ
jgi:hypothetical protein